MQSVTQTDKLITYRNPVVGAGQWGNWRSDLAHQTESGDKLGHHLEEGYDEEEAQAVHG